MTFGQLLRRRWLEACARVGFSPESVDLTWEIADDYPHFKKKRGYAVCFYRGGNKCHLKFSSKVLDVPGHRADALVRHELGHVLDFVLPAPDLDGWARRAGHPLPKTPERKADTLALAIWGAPIRYDEDMVQSTTTGRYPRPKKLGL